MTLYEQYKAGFDKVAASGKPHIARMAMHFDTKADMDAALGFQGATKHWCRGMNASTTSDLRAKAWLEAHAKPATVATPAAPTPPAAGDMLLLAGDAATLAKIARIAAVMGCEAIDV